MVILKSLNPLAINENPSEKMLQFAHMWIASPPVVEMRKYLAPLWKLPPQGFDITPYLGKNFDEIEYFQNPYYAMLTIGLPDSILKKYNLTDAWTKLMVLTIYFNAVLDVEVNQGFVEGFPITFAVGKKAITNKLFDLGEDEAIGLLLPFQISKAQLHKWIDEHWEEIDAAMDNDFVKDIPWLETMKNWGLGKEIDELKQHGFTYKKIADILSDKYPHDERVCDIDQIKKIHKRYLDSKDHFDSGFTRFLSMAGDM